MDGVVASLLSSNCSDVASGVLQAVLDVRERLSCRPYAVAPQPPVRSMLIRLARHVPQATAPRGGASYRRHSEPGSTGHDPRSSRPTPSRTHEPFLGAPLCEGSSRGAAGIHVISLGSPLETSPGRAEKPGGPASRTGPPGTFALGASPRGRRIRGQPALTAVT